MSAGGEPDRGVHRKSWKNMDMKLIFRYFLDRAEARNRTRLDNSIVSEKNPSKKNRDEN